MKGRAHERPEARHRPRGGSAVRQEGFRSMILKPRDAVMPHFMDYSRTSEAGACREHTRALDDFTALKLKARAEKLPPTRDGDHRHTGCGPSSQSRPDPPEILCHETLT